MSDVDEKNAVVPLADVVSMPMLSIIKGGGSIDGKPLYWE